MPEPSNLEILRHSCSHILATAVLEMFPETKFGIGPTIEDGFYYDFDLPRTLIPEDLPILEEKMRKIINKNYAFEKQEIKAEKAIELFAKLKQKYKVDLIKDLQIENADKKIKISLYKTGSFVDLCRGPHIDSTGEIKTDAFKLLKISGAYWRGKEKNPMLQRIYGTAFESKKDLNNYLQKIKEAEKRDHRVLGQKLEIFMFDEEVGAGLPLWLPKGAILRRIIENYLYEELILNDYQWVVTPHIANLNLWKTSGHWELYRENMYSPIKIDEEEYMLKPMNCPLHVKIYNSKIRSYKDLPLRYAELGTVYRYERSGVLHGLTRVRGFTQDDAHIICTPEQLTGEFTKILKHGLRMLKAFGFKDFNIYLSTRPEKYAGTVKSWEKATKTLEYVLGKLKLKYQIDPGGGVFYGPKIDIKIKDLLDREWQCTTIQFDFNLPEKFKITYIDQKGKKKEPYMIHRALLGSLERFTGLLIEHYTGAFPLWLSPIQVSIVPVAHRHRQYAKQIGKILKEKEIRVEIKDAAETVSKKIREAELQKVPYMLVVGDKEMKVKGVRVRDRKKGDIGPFKINKFCDKILKEIDNKK